MDKVVVEFPVDLEKVSDDQLLNALKSRYTSGLIVVAGFPVPGTYASRAYDNGSVTGTATVNWANGNVQYMTLTGNTTLTFTNPLADMRCILNIAGAFTPTFPSTVRWTGGSTPVATALAGKKDLYTFIYSGKESLYDGLQSPNYSIT